MSDDPFFLEREMLRHSFEVLRKNTKQLLGEIGGSQPSLTVHDISHSDALWQVCDLIVGDAFPVTPTEAFILGASFLIHDAGLSVAAFENAGLLGSPIWRDNLALALRRVYGRPATSAELDNPDESIRQSVLDQMLRNKHAEVAARLLTTEWNYGGRRLHLLESEDLRQTYGLLIGEIAASHWWPAQQVAQMFSHNWGPPAGYPPAWRVSPAKIAFALRVADAAHLDASRAPAILMALRQPISISLAHWVFQQRLQQPVVDPARPDRLVYTSCRPFEVGEAQAWWFCFEALSTVDKELHRSDELLVSLGLPRMGVKGVLGVGDPKSLTQYIPTNSWTPVDTRIRVSAVADLVRTLGGGYLYSQGKLSALRELIQNAGDAVRARRIAQNHGEQWGSIEVKLDKDSNGWWLSVTDCGVGMSDALLTGALLDFGQSYWVSDLVVTEHPGLLAHGFQSVGKFGIGFFSVFMLGDVVKVYTRPYREAERDTRVLEFSTGASSVPLLRHAGPTEFLSDGGTTIRVLLSVDPHEDSGLLGSIEFGAKDKSLFTLVTRLCPTVDFEIFVRESDQPRRQAVAASDWITMPAPALLERCHEGLRPHELEDLTQRLDEIRGPRGEILGRAVVFPWTYGEREIAGVLTAGGFRAGRLSRIAGVMTGSPTTASRESAIPFAEGTALATWASKQAEMIKEFVGEEADDVSEMANVLYRCGADVSELPICFSNKGWLTAQKFAKWLGARSEFLVADVFFSEAITYIDLDELVIKQGVLLAHSMHHVVFTRTESKWPPIAHSPNRWWNENGRSLQGLVIDLAAKHWSVTTDAVVKASAFSNTDAWLWRDVATASGKPIEQTVNVIRHPEAVNRPKHFRRPRRAQS